MLPLLSSFILVLVYSAAMQSLPTFGIFERWQVIAFFNSVPAFLAFFWWWWPESEDKVRQAWVIPTLMLVSVFMLIGFYSEDKGREAYSSFDIYLLVVWIPLVEELIFRLGLFNWLKTRFQSVWAIYFSALLFSLAHVSFANPYPPIGPFLLGALSAWAYQKSGRFALAVTIHSVCNASAIVFALYAPSVLDRLSWLYQKL